MFFLIKTKISDGLCSSAVERSAGHQNIKELFSVDD